MIEMQDDRLLRVLRRFEESIKEERRADVVMDGLGTGVRATYFPGHVMDIEGLPELPPILKFEPEGVKVLLQGRFEQLPEEAAKAFNIYRFFDPRTVVSGLRTPSRYNEQTYSLEADLDIHEALGVKKFTLDEKLFDWLRQYDRLVQPVEFVLLNDDVRRMTLTELPPGQQKITLIFSPGNQG
jgi:hypothetical protein